MARYDGSPDAFAAFRDAHPDVNLDRWPDDPPVPSAEDDRDDDGTGREPADGFDRRRLALCSVQGLLQ